MTPAVRNLLTQIRQFEQLHRAGLVPTVCAMSDFFETAREARADVEAFDRGLTPATPPRPRPVAVPVRDALADVLPSVFVAKAAPAPVDMVAVPSDDIVRFAKALLDALESARPKVGA